MSPLMSSSKDLLYRTLTWPILFLLIMDNTINGVCARTQGCKLFRDTLTFCLLPIKIILALFRSSGLFSYPLFFIAGTSEFGRKTMLKSVLRFLIRLICFVIKNTFIVFFCLSYSRFILTETSPNVSIACVILLFISLRRTPVLRYPYNQVVKRGRVSIF